MDDVSFDALTRRASLLTLGVAGLTGLAGSITADAKKKNKKNDKKKCKKQVGQCTAFLMAVCAGDPNCQDSIDCCSSVGSCNMTAFLGCFVASLSG
jgi:hypothetical protein